MEPANINSFSADDISKEKQRIQETLSGGGDTNYQTALTQLLQTGSNTFNILTDKSQEFAQNLRGTILEIKSTERALDELNKKVLAKEITPEAYAKAFAEQSSKVSALTGKVSAELNKLAYTPDNLTDTEKKLNELFKKHQNYFARITKLSETYKKERELLESALTQSQTDEEKKRLQSILDVHKQTFESSLMDEAKKEGFYSILFEDIKKVSLDTLHEAIRQAEEWIAKFEAENDIDPTSKAGMDLDKVKKAVKDAKEDPAYNSSVPMKPPVDFSQGAAGWATQFASAAQKTLENLTQIAEMIGWIDKDAGSTFQTFVGVLNGMNQIGEGVLSVFKGDIVSAVNKSITGTYNIIKTLRNNHKYNKSVRREQEQYLKSLVNEELAYNAVLRERLRIEKQIGETSLDYYNRKSAELNKQSAQIKSEEDSLFAQLQEENYTTGYKYKHGTLFRKAKRTKQEASLAGLSYEEMEELYYEGRLEGNAKSLFEQLQKLKEEGKNVTQMIEQLDEEIRQAWTGTTRDQLVDSIAQGFLDGKKSAEDFAGDFESMMKKAMVQAIKMQYLEKELNTWYEKFAAYSESGGELTPEEIAELQADYNRIVEGGAQRIAQMEEATGITFEKKKEEEKAEAQKGLAAMSQETASELNGRFYALQMISNNINENLSTGPGSIHSLLNDAALQWVAIEENTRYCKKLEGIETDMRTMRNDIQSIALKGVRLIK